VLIIAEIICVNLINLCHLYSIFIKHSLLFFGTLMTLIVLIIAEIICVNLINLCHLYSIFIKHSLLFFGTLMTLIVLTSAEIICVNHINLRHLRSIFIKPFFLWELLKYLRHLLVLKRLSLPIKSLYQSRYE